MYCPRCGAEVAGDDRFCPSCGAPVPHAGVGVAAQPTAPQPAAMPPSPSGQAGPGLPQGPSGAPRPLVVAAAACAGLALILVAMFLAKLGPFAQADAVPVSVSIIAPNYDAATDSPIPLTVRGTTSEGDAVEVVRYVTPASPTFDVEAGTYQVSLAASPLMASGDVYDVDVTASVCVPDSGSGDPVSQADGGDPMLDLVPKDPADVTDGDIDQAVEYAKRASEDPTNDYAYDEGQADRVRRTIEDRRTKAQEADGPAADPEPGQATDARDDQASSPQQDAAPVPYDPADIVGETIDMDLSHNDQVDAADVPMWDFDSGYFTCMMSDELKGVVDFTPMGHTSGAYHVDGCLHGTQAMVMRFDGAAGDGAATLTFCPGGANVIWYAIRNGSCEGVSSADAERYLQVLSDGEMGASDALDLDRTTFANELVGRTRSYQGPVIAASFQVR